MLESFSRRLIAYNEGCRIPTSRDRAIRNWAGYDVVRYTVDAGDRRSTIDYSYYSADGKPRREPKY